MLCRKARQRLARHRQRRLFRYVFDASVAHTQAHLAMQRTWASAAKLMSDLNAAIEESSR